MAELFSNSALDILSFEDKLKFNLGQGYVILLNYLLINSTNYSLNGELIKRCNCLINIKSKLSCLMGKEKNLEVADSEGKKDVISEETYYNIKQNEAIILRGKYLNSLEKENNNISYSGYDMTLASNKDFNKAFFDFENFLNSWEEELIKFMHDKKLINPPKDLGYGDLDESS